MGMGGKVLAMSEPLFWRDDTKSIRTKLPCPDCKSLVEIPWTIGFIDAIKNGEYLCNLCYTKKFPNRSMGGIGGSTLFIDGFETGDFEEELGDW